jgi:hypothetical protein
MEVSNESIFKYLTQVSFCMAALMVTVSLFAQEGNAGAPIVVAW